MSGATRDFVVSILGDSSKVDKVFDAFGEHAEKIAVGAAAAFAGASIGEAISRGMDIQAGQAKLAASLNLTSAQSANAGKAAGSLFANNYGDSMEDVQGAVSDAISGISSLKDANASTVQDITSKLINIRTAFGVDVGESSQAAGELVKNGMAKNTGEAIDLLTNGFQHVPAALRGTLLDSVNEYSPYFKMVGAGGQQMFNVLVDAAKGGDIQIDKAGDAIKEFGIRVTDLTDTNAGPALKRLGLNQRQMADDMLAGGKRGAAATQQIVDGLLKVKDPAQQAKLTAALFGTQIEDIGKGKIPGFLHGLEGMDSGQRKVAGSAAKLDKTLNDTNKNTVTTIQRGMENWTNQLVAIPGPIGTIGSGLVALGPQGVIALGSIAGLAGGALQMGKSFFIAAEGAEASRAKMIAQGIVAAASKVWTVATAVATGVATAAQWAWNAAMDANPIGVIILVLAALVAGLVWFFTQTTLGRQIWSGFITWLVAAWHNVLAASRIIWGAIGSFLSGLWNGITGWIRGVVTGFINWLVGYFRTAVAVQIAVWTAVGTFFRNLWNGAVGFVRAVVTGWVNWMTAYFRAAVALQVRIWTAIGSFFRSLWSGITSWIRNQINILVAIFGGIGSRITSVTRGIWNGLTTGFRAAVNFIIDLWNGLHFSIPPINAGPIHFAGIDFGVPHIPHLATGGVTSGPTYALIGDNPGGREVVQPLAQYKADLERERKTAVATAPSSRVPAGGVHIDNFHAHENQSPYEIAQELGWLSRVG